MARPRREAAGMLSRETSRDLESQCEARGETLLETEAKVCGRSVSGHVQDNLFGMQDMVCFAATANLRWEEVGLGCVCEGC
jgi:hypothetical protein